MAQKRTATQAQVQQELRDYDDSFLLCRDLLHSWVPPGDYFHQGNEIHRILTCGRCGMERRDVWSSRGERISSQYYQPDDYGFEGVGKGGVDRSKIRIERLRRVKVYASASSLEKAVYSNGAKKKAPHLLWGKE